MPPVDQTKADPLTQLFDEIELLTAQTRALELSLKRAHTDAFEEVEKFQQQFRAKLSNLKAEFEYREHSGPGGIPEDDFVAAIQNQDLMRRVAEQQNLTQRAHEESERRGAAIVVLRQQVARLEAANRELEQTAAARVTQNQPEPKPRIAQLEAQLARKDEAVRQLQAEIASRDIEIGELRASAQRQEQAAADALAHARETLRAEAEELRSESGQKQSLLEQRQGAHDAEQELRNRYRELQGRLAAKEAVIESQEYHLRSAQTQLLAAREALSEKERALAEAQARAAEEGQRIHNERNEWQCRFAEIQLLAERRSGDIERAKTDLALALKGHDDLAQQASAMRQESQQLSARLDELNKELNEKQATLDSQGETLRRSEAREAELSAALAEARDALAQQESRARHTEQNLTSEIAGLRSERERSTEAPENSTAMRQVIEESNALRARLAEVEARARQDNEIATQRWESDGRRIADLEQELESNRQMLAKRQAGREGSEQQPHRPTAASETAGAQVAEEEQGPELRAAQTKIAELLDRLAQLEAARHSLQENAGHELQQLRESFETRISKLRMELAAKEHSGAPAPAPADTQLAVTRLAEGFQEQIQQLHSQLAEQHTLLENRNEELIRVKAELDQLHDRFAPTKGGTARVSRDKSGSVELREEDAVDLPQQFNGSAKHESLRARGAGALGENLGAASTRFTELEGRVRAWNPHPEKDSAFASSRRWHIGLFKRRWKA